MKINCDIGERGADHPVDRNLMRQIDIANIACGGHAGDDESITAFGELAKQYGVTVSAHLSYPDREHFGRRSPDISFDQLTAALDEQLDRLPEADTVKFHGALYNDSVKDPELAERLTHWLVLRKIQTVIAPGGSHMAEAAEAAGLRVLAEAFADRGYRQDENGRLHLLDRSHPDALFQTIENALDHCRRLTEHRVRLADGKEVSIQADTLCIHSDSAIAAPLIQELRRLSPPFKLEHAGLSTFVRKPVYGEQSVGDSPGGPQDRFACETGCVLIEAGRLHALEFILPPVLRFTRHTQLILTGARFDHTRIERDNLELAVPHGAVFEAQRGDILRFGKNRTGFRGYLNWNDTNGSRTGTTRPPLTELITWRDPAGNIRLLPGPEIERLASPDALISKPWTISADSGPMGIRLDNPGKPLQVREENMISAPVTDGTVQLTPTGPIILMRNRQTVGGYPRVANVIEVDLDRFAQFRPGETVHFTWTDLKTARQLLNERTAALHRLDRC